MKTKRTSSGGRSAKRKKTHGNTCISSVLGRSFDTPRHFVEFLLSPIPLDTFTTKHWEREPLVCHSRDGHAEFWAPLFGKEMFFGLLKEKSIHFARDVAVCKYADGKRTDFERQGRVTEAKMRKLFQDDKATMQIHQPQRWVNGLWEALEMLECFFGCLVGCNAYVTPPVAQGLAPHYDDVEVFIVQLEGEKCWKLYKPPVELPRSYSKNFDEAEIGTPTHEFTLKPGDLLYMPRGTIHQAWTPESSGTHSTHITISTYQNHTVGDCLKAVAPDLIDAAVDSCADLRRGLPLQFLPHSRLSKAAVEAALEAVLNHVRKTKDVELVAEDMVLDFMRTRLPPFGVDRRAISETTPDGKAPGVNNSVRFRYPSHVTYLLDDGTAAEGEGGTAEESSSYSLAEQPLQQHRGEKMVLLVTSVFNNREAHMVSTGGDEDDDDEDSEVAKFPLHFLDAIKTLCASKEFVCGKDLSLPSDEDRLLLLTTLWSLHLLDVRES